MRTNLTDLRANLYNKIDELIETGASIKIERKGQIKRRSRYLPAGGV